MIYVYYTKLIMLLFLCSSIRTKGAHAIIHKRVRISSTHFYGTHKGQTDSHRQQGNKQKIYMHINTLDTHTHTHCITTAKYWQFRRHGRPTGRTQHAWRYIPPWKTYSITKGERYKGTVCTCNVIDYVSSSDGRVLTQLHIRYVLYERIIGIYIESI